MIAVVDCISFAEITDKTRITILDHSGCPLASGNWFQDQILNYTDAEVIRMTYLPLENRLVLRIRGSLFDYE